MTAPFQGPRAPFGGRPGSGGDSTLTFTTVAAMDANVPTVRTVAVNLAPMFGPAGGRFVFNVALGAWVPETTVRIYGTGAGTVYTAAAGDINTDVVVGSLPVIPSSICPNGSLLLFSGRFMRSPGGAAGNVNVKILRSGISIGTGISGQNSDVPMSGSGTIFSGVLRRFLAGAAPQTFSPASGGYQFNLAFNAPTVNMVQTLAAYWADLSYVGYA